jgi:MoxR-like ATPase
MIMTALQLPIKLKNLPTTKDTQPGDRRDGKVYYYANSEIELAVNAALAAQRPLLISGQSGSGKSSLARNIARQHDLGYLETVITGRTKAQDLLWRFDTVRRLADAQTSGAQKLGEGTVNGLKSDAEYHEPGPLWWAIDPISARNRGSVNPAKNFNFAIPTFLEEPTLGLPTVLLIDEIDKADIDLPNSLLTTLGSYFFQTPLPVTMVKLPKNSPPPLVIITNNQERNLPDAFVRRCIHLVLKNPNKKRLEEIGVAHFGEELREFCGKLAEKIIEISSSQTTPGKDSSSVSAAEYLDAVNACQKIGITIKDPRFKLLMNMTVLKSGL